ncbi:MAG: hypothetical protein QOJ70_1817 [Acidobacteriota bacterium]|nr:hypothetical protein [Acidobacteriota bacterium]
MKKGSTTPLFTLAFCLAYSAATRSTRHDQFRRGQHRGQAPVLPAANGAAAHSTLAGRPLLRPRAADVDHLVRLSRSLVRSPIGAVYGLRLRGSSDANGIRLSLRTRRWNRCEFQSPSLNYERRRQWPQESAKQKARPEERTRNHDRRRKTLASEASPATTAETSARPHAPTRAHDALAALAAEVRLVHGFRISFEA